MIAYRACNGTGLKFGAFDRTVQWADTSAYTIPVSPRSPDMHGELVAFACGEDGLGTRMMRPGEQPWTPAGITWRSVYPGRFAPDGTYFLSDRWDAQGRAAYWTWRDGVLSGPFPSGTTNIEGIADFTQNGPAGWTPVWQNRGKPITVDGYVLPIWFRTAHWLCGINSPTDRFIAKDLRSGVWYLVTNETSPVPPNSVKEQADGTLLIAWNGNTESFLWSGDGWPPVQAEPIVIPTFPKTDQRIGVGVFDDPNGPARIIVYDEVVTPNVRAVVWGVGTSGATKTKALAKSLDVGALAYKDNYGIKSGEVPVGFRALVFAYASEALSVAEALGKVDQTLEVLAAAKVPCDLAMSTYCKWDGHQYDLPEQKVLDMMAGVWRLGLAFRVGAIWCYTQRKPIAGPVIKDGLEQWPNLRTAVARMKAASADWQHFPPYSVTPPVTPFWQPLGAL